MEKIKNVVLMPEGAMASEERAAALNFMGDWDFGVTAKGTVGLRNNAAYLKLEALIAVGPLVLPFDMDKEIPVNDYTFEFKFPK